MVSSVSYGNLLPQLHIPNTIQIAQSSDKVSPALHIQMLCPLLALAAITVAVAKLPTADLVGSHDKTPSAAADDHTKNTPAEEVDTAKYNCVWRSKKSNKKVRKTSSSKSTKTNGENLDQHEQVGTKTSIRQGYSQPSFPTVLMGIMIPPQNAKHIAFLSNERSFIIIHPGEFAEKVIPTCFDGVDVLSYDQCLHLLTAW
jgi:hypothetical protein